MRDVQKLSIALTAEQVDALKAPVASGEYATTSEVIREAVRDWQLKYELRRDELKRLRRLWDEGECGGEPAPVDFDRLRQEARRRLKLSGERRSHNG